MANDVCTSVGTHQSTSFDAWSHDAILMNIRRRNICLRAVVCAGAPLLFSLAPASAQLLGIPQVNVPLPPPGEVPEPGPVGVLERPRPQLQPQGFQLSGVTV